jgi:2-polyprenyl-3-methyl-5-hydroxy-6-metoxy-1,4-benzoquinol methylase
MTATTDIDISVVQRFAGKVLADLTAQQMGPLSAVADRLGLFQSLADVGPVTANEFAQRTGFNERYIREWLSAMACHGYVHYDNANETFRMPTEHAVVLADSDSPFYLGSTFTLAESYWRHIDQLAEAFRSGGGVSQSGFGERFWCGYERFTGPTFRNYLCQQWIRALPGVDAALRAGGTAADVGCGNGQAVLVLARGYPDARVVGYDNYAPAIAAAQANARAASLDDRVRFELCDVVQGISGTFDLITLFDVLHDMPHPQSALESISRALRPGGTCFVSELNVFGDLAGNIEHPLGFGAFAYSASVNYCLTQALAEGGVGTGTCMGEERVRALASESGFTSVQRLDFPDRPFNVFYALEL